MPENRPRWRTPTDIASHIAAELAAARSAADPWPHLERAHLLSQPWWWPHTSIHATMLTTALRARDPRETLGQIIRLVVAGPGSITGRYPPGNTGRATMALTRTGPVPHDIQTALDPYLLRPYPPSPT